MTSQTSLVFKTIMPKTLKQQNRGATPASSHNAKGAWQIQTAKARFSEVFRLARTEGPQRITRQGKEAVVMISEEQYDRLIAKSRQPKSIVQFFRQSPLFGVELDLERDKDAGRDIEL